MAHLTGAYKTAGEIGYVASKQITT